MGAEQSSPTPEISEKIKPLTSIRFHLQDEEHEVKDENVNPNTSLNFYLRNTLHLTGTKSMCYEGGCGSCVVAIKEKNPINGKDEVLAINSCLIPLLCCNGLKIYTIEGIGNPLDGYHPIQQVLAKFNGTQCGFCSPGMVMNMYALYQSGKLTMEQVEKSFGGNICRCTGYRPILSAFKSLCKDATTEILGEYPDIEDLRVPSCMKECAKIPEGPFQIPFSNSTHKWVKVYTLEDLLNTLRINPGSSYRLVAGNTAQGVYKSYNNEVQLYIDINDVQELNVHEVNGNSCVIGAVTTLYETIEFLRQTATKPRFLYLQRVAHHIVLIANVPVRNRATIGGNLMIKHDHHEFPSDMFLLMETVGAVLTIVGLDGQETKLSPLEFISYNMNFHVLKTITLKTLPNQAKFKSFKIMARAQNTHALVNTAFLCEFGQDNIVQSATLVYGNISSKFVHAKQTEGFLVGKNLFDNSVLQQAYNNLSVEINPEDMPPEPSPKFRKQLAVALFYKCVLAIAPDGKVSPKNKSGGSMIQRPISKGAQDYETNKSMYPLTQALPKLEALAQTSGQAEYIDDMPDLPYQLFGALVLAKCPPNSKITNIDASKALKQENIVAFFTKDDIPGNNTFTYANAPVSTTEEDIFCRGTVKYYEQPVGILIGRSQNAVDVTTDLVEISYDAPTAPPLLTIRQVLKAGRKDRINEYKVINAKTKGNDIKHVIKVQFDIYHQYHFHMETQTCRVVPNENGLDVYPSTQWMHMTQLAIARMLNIPMNRVSVHVRRCGGGFGGKLTRNGFVSCAAALASWKLKKPVSVRIPLTTNMAAIGKRFPCTADYEVGVNDKGVIQYLNCVTYTDVGMVSNEKALQLVEKVFTDTYVSDTFTVRLNTVVTDTPTNTWMRAPGTLESVSLIETIMEHMSYEVGVDPTQVRLSNLSPQSPLVPYINEMKSWANTAQLRSEIDAFNKQNRWKKRGMSLVPMNFYLFPLGPHLATVSIFQGDGSVQISHGGIEIGQGINTKAAQVCAYKFQIPLEKVQVLPAHSFISANNMGTGASITSEGICYGVEKACNELLERMKPYRSEGAKWEDVIQKSYENGVNLVANGKYDPHDLEGDVKAYSVYGVCVAEVEVDILTGKHVVTRVHIIEDTGRSLNPVIDVGQVEGAFVMGLGYNTTEKVELSTKGKVLTRNTWTYYPPGAQDIPVDFLVRLQKNNVNPVGVLKSKGTGEPPICLSMAVPLAIRNAAASARTDASPSNSKWYGVDGPSTVPNVFINSLNDYHQYVL